MAEQLKPGQHGSIHVACEITQVDQNSDDICVILGKDGTGSSFTVWVNRKSFTPSEA